MTSSADLSDQFFLNFASMCQRLGCAPVDLLGVAAYESGVRSTAHNQNGHASGLWQLTPEIARGLGWNVDSDPELAGFRALDPVEQLVWFERFFTPYRGKLINATACYVATFLPAFIEHAGEPDYVLCGKNGPRAWAYVGNTSFDVQRTGVIRVADLEPAIERGRQALGARWTEIVQRLENAMNAAQEGEAPPSDEVPDDSTDEHAISNG